MSPKTKLIIFFALILFMPAKVQADEPRAYDLKVKLKCNVQKREAGDTSNNSRPFEAKNWQFGFLSAGNNIPPLIIGKENFYPPIDNYYEHYFWGKNDMKLLVLNPLAHTVKTSLLFSAASFKEPRSLEIIAGSSRKEIIKVPAQDKFVDFRVDNIFLIPGINEIILFSPERPSAYQTSPDVYNADMRIKELMGKPVTIKFKDFRFADTTATNAKISEQPSIQQGYFLNDDSVEILLTKEDEIKLISQDTDADLEEFSIFTLESIQNNACLISCFGIDYTADGIIDDYLYSEDLGAINLFEMAKDKWKHINTYKDVFYLKKVILLILPQEEAETEEEKQQAEIKNQGKEEDQVYNLTLNNANLSSSNYLTLAGRENGLEQLKVEAFNVLYEARAENGWVAFFTYFKPGSSPSNIYDINTRVTLKDNAIESTEHSYNEYKQEAESDELRAYVPLDKTEVDNFPYLSFRHNLDNEGIQDINLALLLAGAEREETVIIPSNKYDKSNEKIEVNLKPLIPEGSYPKDLIIIFKEKGSDDLFGQEEGRWYKFKIKDIIQYDLIPYPLKSKKSKERFSRFLEQINPDLLKINEKIFRFSDFEWPQNMESLEKDIFTKRIELPSGNNTYKKLKNWVFDCEWAILEPAISHQPSAISHQPEPQITFKRINPTKYLVKVEKAKGPFWLVFSESFHNGWQIFLPGKYEEKNRNSFNQIIASYPKLGVKEAEHLTGIAFQDAVYLFKKPLDIVHYLVNDYANGWYLEPEKLGLGENFTVMIYFFPQGFFYLGLAVSLLIALGCVLYLILSFFKGKFANVKN